MMSTETVKLPYPISLKKSKRILRTVEDVERLAYARTMKSKVDHGVMELLQAVIDSMNLPPPPDAHTKDIFIDEQLDNFFTQACTDAGVPISLIMEFSTYDLQEVDDAIDRAMADLTGDIDPSALPDHRSCAISVHRAPPSPAGLFSSGGISHETPVSCRSCLETST